MKVVVAMKAKFRQILGSVKDHASISKAIIFGRNLSSDLEIAVVRATKHDNTPIDERYVHELLFVVSNSPTLMMFLARKISQRLRSQNQIVSLKALFLVHRLLRGGDHKFEQDLRSAYLCGYLNIGLQCFPKNYNSTNLFLYQYAAFLEERLGWFINQAGKLEPIISSESKLYKEKPKENVFFRLPRCQDFLDRVMGCFPVDPVDFISLHALINILRESFQVYVSFNEGVITLLDSFFDFKKPERASALKIFRRASSQSYKLSKFFEICNSSIGLKSLSFPSVAIITEECVSTMEEVLESSKACGNPSLSAEADHRPMIFQPVKPVLMEIDKSKEANTSKAMEKPFSVSKSLFSYKLETRISRVWVDFNEEDRPSPSLFTTETENKSRDISEDPRISSLQISHKKPYCYYNPFIDPMEPRIVIS